MANYLLSRFIQQFVTGNDILPNDIPNKVHSFIGGTPYQLSLGKANIYGYSCYNPNATDVFLKFFEKSTIPVLGSDFPFWTVQIPTLNSVVLQGTDILTYSSNSDLWVAVTVGYLDNDVVVPPLNCLVQVTYKF